MAVRGRGSGDFPRYGQPGANLALEVTDFSSRRGAPEGRAARAQLAALPKRNAICAGGDCTYKDFNHCRPSGSLGSPLRLSRATTPPRVNPEAPPPYLTPDLP